MNSITYRRDGTRFFVSVNGREAGEYSYYPIERDFLMTWDGGFESMSFRSETELRQWVVLMADRGRL